MLTVRGDLTIRNVLNQLTYIKIRKRRSYLSINRLRTGKGNLPLHKFASYTENT